MRRTVAFDIIGSYRKVVFYNVSRNVPGLIMSTTTISPNPDRSRYERYKVIAKNIVNFFDRAPAYEPTRAEERVASKSKKKAGHG